jgi:hypothetical protein
MRSALASPLPNVVPMNVMSASKQSRAFTSALIVAFEANRSYKKDKHEIAEYNRNCSPITFTVKFIKPQI